jgi:hypothetical protein
MFAEEARRGTTLPGFAVFFKSAGTFACADGFVPSLRDVPKQKDKNYEY